MAQVGHDSRPGNNWNGHLPSNKMEREILNCIDGQEDEDGNLSSFLRQEDPEMAVFRQRRSNTGPKGVQEDAKRHAAMQALQRQADAVRQQEMLRRAANPTVKPATDASKWFADKDDADDDEEDEEFQRYRLARLQQMHAVSSASSKLPTFGHVEAIEVDDYPEAVDKPGSAETYVVVHLQEDNFPACVRLGYKLEALAAKYDQVRFLSVSASQAKPDLEPERLPCLIVYHHNGEYAGSLERVGKDAGEGLTVDMVESFLTRLSVRLTSSAAMKAADAAALARLRELGAQGPSSRRGGEASEEDEEDEEDEEEDDDDDGTRAGIRRIGALSIR